VEYLNFDLEIGPRSEDRYPVGARSEAGEVRHWMRFPLDGLALENVLLRVQNALLRTGNVRRGMGTPEEQVVQSFGRALFEALLVEDVRRLYDASAARATQQGKGLRLRLRIQAPELAALPWEFLYDPLQHEYVCFLPDVVLVRYLETAQPIPPFKVELPLRVLAMLADPSDLDRLNVAHERQRLSDALRPLEELDLVRLRWVEGQTVRDLHQALLQRDWHIFHYIGHGAFDARTQEGVLALVNEQGTTHLLGATDLGRMLAQRHSLRLVVLNSCQGAAGSRHDLFSSTAATLASKRIPAVLAMQYDITDQAAMEFTRGFYGALAVGMPVDGAVTQARTAISVGAPRTLEWVTPVLYLRAPTGVLFEVPPPVTKPRRSGQSSAQVAPPAQPIAKSADTTPTWPQPASPPQATPPSFSSPLAGTPIFPQAPAQPMAAVPSRPLAPSHISGPPPPQRYIPPAGPFGAPAPAAPQPAGKRRSLLSLVGVAVVLVLLIGGVASAVFYNGPKISDMGIRVIKV
jgi:hypothetical protein